MPRKQRRWVTAAGSCAVFFATAACDGDGSPANGKDVSLSLCAETWWREPVAGACGCSGRAECAAPDCESIEVLRLRRDGTFQSGVITRSASTQTLGFVGAMSGGIYEREADGYRFVPDMGQSYVVSQFECSSDRLVLNQIVRVPADESLASAIDRQLAEGR